MTNASAKKRAVTRKRAAAVAAARKISIEKPEKIAEDAKTTNVFEKLRQAAEYESESEDDEVEPIRQAKKLPECGTDNLNGTFFGGGPLDIHCSKCQAAGLPEDYGHGHRSNQHKYCPVLQAKTSTDLDKLTIDPKLKDIADSAIPEDKGAKLQSKSNSESLQSMQHMKVEDIMISVTEGRCTATQAKLALLKKIPAASPDDREVLQIFIKSISDLSPPVAKQSASQFAMPGALDQQGKLVKLWLAVVVHSKKQLNQQGGKAVAEEQQPTVNLLTMEISVKAPKKQASGTMGVFYLALEHFRHLCRARDVLSEAESHALSTWLATQLGIRRPLEVVEATLLELAY